MQLIPKQVVHNIVTNGKIDDGLRMIEELIAEEREACAKIADDKAKSSDIGLSHGIEAAEAEMARDIAKAIRGRCSAR